MTSGSQPCLLVYQNSLLNLGQNCWFGIGLISWLYIVDFCRRCIIMNFLCNHHFDSLRHSFCKRINTSLLSDTRAQLKVKTAFSGMRRRPQWEFLGLSSEIDYFWDNMMLSMCCIGAAFRIWDWVFLTLYLRSNVDIFGAVFTILDWVFLGLYLWYEI